MFISGATVHAAAINGIFDPTQEKGADGRVLYIKRGDASVCIEHFTTEKLVAWQVKPVSSKGNDSCYARLGGDCALEACTSHVWEVSADGKTFSNAPDVKIVTEAEVSCCCMRVLSTCHRPCPLLFSSPPLTPSSRYADFFPTVPTNT